MSVVVLLHRQCKQVIDQPGHPVDLMEHAVAEKLFILLHRPSAQNLDPGTDPGQRIFDLVGQRR